MKTSFVKLECNVRQTGVLLLRPAADPKATDEFLSLLDVLVDGPFVEELHDITLLFRGSSNQRLIHVPSTLRSGQISLWEP